MNGARAPHSRLTDRRIDAYPADRILQQFNWGPARKTTSLVTIAVSPDLSFRELVEGYFYRHHHKVFPVVDRDQLVGCVTTDQISAIGEEQWD